MRRYSRDSPGPTAQPFVRYVAEFVTPKYGVEISAAQAQAFFSFHNEWQRWRNAPGGEAEREKLAQRNRLRSNADLGELRSPLPRWWWQ